MKVSKKILEKIIQETINKNLGIKKKKGKVLNEGWPFPKREPVRKLVRKKYAEPEMGKNVDPGENEGEEPIQEGEMDLKDVLQSFNKRIADLEKMFKELEEI